MTLPNENLSSNPHASQPSAWFNNKTKAAAGIITVGALVFLSRPLISYYTREACYHYYGENSWWPNPIKGLAQSVASTYQCEWMGHYGFQWHEAVSFLSSGWQTLLGTLGSGVGLYSFMKRGQANRAASASQTTQEANTEEVPSTPQNLEPIFQAIDKGFLPLKETQQLKQKAQTAAIKDCQNEPKARLRML